MRLYQALVQSGDRRAATEFVESWVKTHPRDSVALRALAEASLRDGNPGGARRRPAGAAPRRRRRGGAEQPRQHPRQPGPQARSGACGAGPSAGTAGRRGGHAGLDPRPGGSGRRRVATPAGGAAPCAGQSGDSLSPRVRPVSDGGRKRGGSWSPRCARASRSRARPRRKGCPATLPAVDAGRLSRVLTWARRISS